MILYKNIDFCLENWDLQENFIEHEQYLIRTVSILDINFYICQDEDLVLYFDLLVSILSFDYNYDIIRLDQGHKRLERFAYSNRIHSKLFLPIIINSKTE